MRRSVYRKMMTTSTGGQARRMMSQARHSSAVGKAVSQTRKAGKFARRHPYGIGAGAASLGLYQHSKRRPTDRTIGRPTGIRQY